MTNKISFGIGTGVGFIGGIAFAGSLCAAFYLGVKGSEWTKEMFDDERNTKKSYYTNSYRTRY